MYFHYAKIKNLGPLSDVTINAAFDGDKPRPLVIVGSNGGGKTHLLALIADGLLESSSAHYSDVLGVNGRGGRHWFRVVGGVVRTVGTVWSAAVVRFADEIGSYWLVEKSGTVPPPTRESFPAATHADLAGGDENHKRASMSAADAKRIFASGSYTYFPSSRSEVPHWLNAKSVQPEEIDDNIRYATELGKTMFLERGLHELAEWIAPLITDSRMDFGVVVEEGGAKVKPIGNVESAFASTITLNCLNAIIKLILGDSTAKFVWLGRRGYHRVGIHRDGKPLIIGLRSLSSGQATLLSIFGNVLRHSDDGGILSLANIKGVCVVDEVDAHLHVDLQYNVLPKLVALFSGVQFVMSCHSPLAVLGFAASNTQATIVDISTGLEMSAEQYSEFGHAFDAMKSTGAFASAIKQTASMASDRLLVLVEGETDPLYLKAAVAVLDRENDFDQIDIEWIGAKDGAGGTFNTGKDALNNALSLLKANPDLLRRPILLLYDCDTNKPLFDGDRLFTRTVPLSAANGVITAGIENLLPPETIGEEFYDVKQSLKANGTRSTIATLDKMRLATAICDRRTVSDFAGFSLLLDTLVEVSSLAKSSGKTSQ